jgi:5-methylcytosine-specific restriction endonuclease McrA
MIRKISKKKAQRIKEWKTEKAVFEKIRMGREHNCCICWKYIYEAKAHNFDHIIPKSRWEQYRLNESNIQIVCFACHFEKTTWLKYKGVDYN